MTKLTDTQAILLSTAARRDGGNLLPPPETLGLVSARIRKAVATLIKRDLAREVDTSDADACWREEGERRFGAVITAAGLAAIGIESEQPSNDDPATSQPSVPEDDIVARASDVGGQTKAAMVLGLLRRKQGATLNELVAATGWLPHTTRAALTGLRKKEHVIDRGKRDDATCYRITAAA